MWNNDFLLRVYLARERGFFPVLLGFEVKLSLHSYSPAECVVKKFTYNGHFVSTYFSLLGLFLP